MEKLRRRKEKVFSGREKGFPAAEIQKEKPREKMERGDHLSDANRQEFY